MEYYAEHSRFSDPGPHERWLRGTPGDVESLRDIASGLVFHYWGNEEIARRGIAAERYEEINLRYASDMFGRLRELDPSPLGARRREADRILGCCRDSTLLLVSLARHHGIPARSRVGFASYLVPGWHLDHVVAEVFVAGEWRLVEPQFDRDHAAVDVLDVPRTSFLTAPEAWLATRAGTLDPTRFAVSPDLPEPFLRGFPYLHHNLVLDLAALNKHEMILWDIWGALTTADHVPEHDAHAADILAQSLNNPTIPQSAEAFTNDRYQVPGTIVTIPPTTNLPREVTLR
ncbi:transglutaminase domain-containing protein [Actinosynnema sp. NPDC020468]|uniref:transglutaminase domain-containing protein n=1 Tax=Actinosynnema sp. NPDC020468 TaxID=3154488 RepID=UPI0033EC9AEF